MFTHIWRGSPISVKATRRNTSSIYVPVRGGNDQWQNVRLEIALDGGILIPAMLDQASHEIAAVSCTRWPSLPSGVHHVCRLLVASSHFRESSGIEDSIIGPWWPSLVLQFAELIEKVILQDQ
jgi:hypothetical protein